MTGANKFHLRLLVQKSKDGRFSISSPTLPGLHMAGKDLEKIHADLEPIIKDLLWHNSEFAVDRIEWVPSLEQVIQNVNEALSDQQEAVYVVTGKRAA